MNAEQQAATLADIKRRHSSLHVIDERCCDVMEALIKMVGPCVEHGLDDKLRAVQKSTRELHAAMKQKFEGL